MNFSRVFPHTKNTFFWTAFRLLLILGGLAYSLSLCHGAIDEGLIVPGEVVVGVKKEADSTQLIASLADIGTEIESNPDIRAHRLKLRPGLSVEAAIAEIMKRDEVLYAEPNYIGFGAATPNDSFYSTQQYAPQKVQADVAWNIWLPKAQRVIAVLDTGVDYNHPDIVNKLYRNAGGTVIGYNFIANNTNASDDQGHGTHVAGSAVAQTNNSAGIAGIAGWTGLAGVSDTSYTKLMPVKVLDNSLPAGIATSTGMANGITWAANNGANVISISVTFATYSSQIDGAVQYAWSQGCVIVAIAGNNQSSSFFYPAANSNVISVASTDSNDTLASDSNYGSWVDVAAPGVNIYSTVPTYTVPRYGVLNYASDSGTSFACPHVSGEAALLWAQNPNLTNSQVASLITSHVDAYTPYLGRTIGGGRINIYRALRAAGYSRPYPDFNWDGKADIIFQHQTSTNVAFWLTNRAYPGTFAYEGKSATGEGPTPDPGYKVVGAADFNSDGLTDIVFQHQTTTAVAFWIMSDDESGTWADYGALAGDEGPYPSAGYQVVGTGDFNNDGKPDIVFQHQTTTNVAFWLMNGTDADSGAPAGGYGPTPASGYKVVGTGDVDQDGQTDIVFQHQTSGVIAFWMMSGTSVSSGVVASGVSVPSGYRAVGVSDFNGDNKPDILLQHTTSGNVGFLLMDGTVASGFTAATGQGPTPSSGYLVVGPR